MIEEMKKTLANIMGWIERNQGKYAYIDTLEDCLLDLSATSKRDDEEIGELVIVA